MNVLVTGANGMLGSKIVSSLVNDEFNNINVFARARSSELQNVKYFYQDLTATDELEKNVKEVRPDVIIHCAANVNISDCESNKEEVYSLHVEASGTLARSAPQARFVYISTDSVYDGLKGNYLESDPAHPINYYAETKLLGEQAVLENSSNAIIVRTNIYGFNKSLKSSLAEWAISNLKAGNTINGFEDVFFNPLYIGQVAGSMNAFINNNTTGIIHLGTREYLSKYQFLVKLCKVFNYNEANIRKSSVSEVEALNNRPRNTTLQTGNLNEKFKLTFSIDEGMQMMYQDYKKMLYE